MKYSYIGWGLLAVMAAGLTACRKADPVSELEKTAVAIEKAEKAPATAAGDFDPAVAATIPSKEVKQAITEFKAGKMEDAVTRLHKLRAQSNLSPQQRLALQDSIAAVMAEVYSLAEKGDAKAAAAVTQYERMQTSGH